MADFLYEMHLHTAVSSRCASLEPEEVVRMYAALGYAGVFVTDHFVTGSCRVDRSLPWADQMRAYARSYERVRDAAAGTGLDVFFGVEYHFGGGIEALLYGITPEYLIEHDKITSMCAWDALDMMRADGIVAFQAHPFRKRGYIPVITLYHEHVDGIEVYNPGNGSQSNHMAEYYAKEFGFRTICGSDVHHPHPSILTAFSTPFRLQNAKDILKAIDTGETKIHVLENPYPAPKEPDAAE